MSIKKYGLGIEKNSFEIRAIVCKPAIRHTAACMMLLLGAAGLSYAQSAFEEDFDNAEKVWTEVAIQLPAPPSASNLFPIFVSATTTQSFSVDIKSLTLGTDGVVRYTMAAKSSSGAKNISYEGIRCQSFEKKLYAFGQQDGSWTRSRRDKWEPIKNNLANRQHAALAQDYLCQGLAVAGKQEEIIERIRKQNTLTQQLK